MLTAALPFLFERDLRLLAMHSRLMRFEPGAVVAGRGSEWQALLFVRAGHLRILGTSPDEPVVFRRFGPGDCYPDLVLGEDGRVARDMVAEGQLELEVIESRALEQLVTQHPMLGVRLYRGLASSLCRNLTFHLELLDSVLDTNGLTQDPRDTADERPSSSRRRVQKMSES